MLTVDIGTCLVSACWRRPDHNEDAAADFWSHITETTHDAHARCIPWVGLGDWNHTPEEMWMCTAGYVLDCAVKDSDGSNQPSRWQGRCVDNAVATQAGLRDEAVRGYKVYMANLNLGHEAPNFYMAPTHSHLKPDGVSSEVWRTTVARCWQRANAIPVTTAEHEWYILSMLRRRNVCAALL